VVIVASISFKVLSHCSTPSDVKYVETDADTLSGMNAKGRKIAKKRGDMVRIVAKEKANLSLKRGLLVV
jgi:hypothetical protein